MFSLGFLPFQYLHGESFVKFFEVKSNATFLEIIPQNLVTNRTLTMLGNTQRRQVKEQKNVNKTKSLLSRFSNYFNAKTRNKESSNILYNNTCNILLSGDIERNPGPESTGQQKDSTGNWGKKKNSFNEIDIVTYNCRGLKDYKKLKRLLNTCSKILQKCRLGIVLLQETHLDRDGTKKLDLMWRGKYVSSPGEGASRGCVTLFDSSWGVDDSYESIDGRLTVTALTSGNVSIIVVNSYAPNDHNLNNFEELFNKLIEYKDKFPDHEVVLAGDLNLVMNKESDSINRVDSAQERISRDLITNNLAVLDMFDVFRQLHKLGGYTWSRGNKYSRLDYVIVTTDLAKHCHEAKVDWTFDRSDHAAVKVKLRLPNACQRGPGLSKVNADVLMKPQVRNEFLDKIKHMLNETPSNWDPNKQLEFLKVITRSTLSEIVGREKRIEAIEYDSLCEQLNRLKNNHSNNLKGGHCVRGIEEAISELQQEIDSQLNKKAEAIAMKAKCKWFDEGEKSNKYFLNLLKRRKSETVLSELSNGNQTAQSQSEIEDLVVKFYGQLYEIDDSLKDDFNSFFPELPQLDDDDRQMLDERITLDELKETLKGCSESAPGPDGIPYLVYKTCWEVYGPIILNSWNFCKEKGILHDFNSTSTIMLIPKEGKDPKQIGNWHPITLTNCDLKIFTKTLSNRVAKVLPKIIVKAQVAYIPGRVVHDNLRMFEFFDEYCKENNIDAVLISLDAAKAFDSVDHRYMFETLKRYGFPENFINTVKLLYKEIKADILVNGFRTVMIRIRRCVKQGDALSCALFIICLDPVLRNIENNKRIKAIEVVLPLSNTKIKQ